MEKTYLLLTIGLVAVAGWFIISPGIESAMAADEGGVYYVSPTGSDTNPGTRELPWRSPEYAGERAEAGDTVIFLAGEYSGRLVPRNSGTAQAPIVFRAEQRRMARLIGHAEGTWTTGESGVQALAGGRRIEVAGLSHIEIRGFEVRDTSEDKQEGGWARIADSSHVTIADCGFSGGYLYICFLVEDSEQIRILDNDMARGTEASDIWSIRNSRRVLMEGNSFSRTGHATGAVRDAREVVIRGNAFHAGWARNFSIGPLGCSQILVEGNVLANQFNGGRAAGPVNQILGERLILRFNTTFDACGLAWTFGGYSKTPHTHNRTYHNVFHGNHGVALAAGTAYGNFRDLILQNNVFDRNDPFGSGTQFSLTGGDASSVRLLHNVLYSGREDAGALILYDRTPLSLNRARSGDRWAREAVQPVTHTTAAGEGRALPVASSVAFARLNAEADGRIMVRVGDEEALAGVTGVSADGRDLALDREIAWEADAPVIILPVPDSAIFSGNIEADPRFAEPAARDFSPADDSPLIDAGAPLTVTRAVGSGHLLPVEDVYPFYDGYGIEGEAGDLIAVGTPERRARVVNADPEARVLRLDRALRWDAGEPVSFPWEGSGPDVGLFEHGGNGRASVQVVADRVYVRPGDAVTLRAVTRGMTEPCRYEWHLGDGTLSQEQTVTHRYTEARDYGVRVRVTDAEGERRIGVGYVKAEPPPSDDVLIHSTFDADDPDWFVYWQFYRGRRSTGNASYRRILDEETGDGYVRVYPRDDPAPLPAFIHPRGWDIDRYPLVRIRYRIRNGTPIAMFVRPFPSAYYTLWDVDSSQDSRRYYFAGTPNVLARAPLTGGDDEARPRGPLPREPFPRELIADGQWHEITFDVRDIRTKHPDVQVLQALHIGDLEVDGGARVGPRDEFALDEVYIGK